jgi:hypothetical protein
LKVAECQIGPRVDVQTRDALKRLAAITEISISKYAAKVLVGHVAKQQTGGGSVDLEDALGRLERRIAEMVEGQRRHFEVSIKRVEKGLLAVRVMIDAHVQTCEPKQYGEWRQATEAMLRSMGIQTVESNGKPHE